ncbi:12360_t:CDS:2, partial [Cetraspora pellucida]
MQQDIVTHFSRFVKPIQKHFHESFMIINSIPWWNIDFDKSYVFFYSKREQKEKFDTLEHSKIIPYYDFFKCKCEFHPHLWQYDPQHKDSKCSFRSHCEYFKLLQS